MRRAVTVLGAMLAATVALAKVDLVTLPGRETVQLTIYNSADMTLVRESRGLTLLKGQNHLQFSWANTLIDPTSLEMLPKANAGQIEVSALDYPPRVQNLGVWNVRSGVSGKVPVEITYLTSGLSWRAFYMGTLTADETAMRLEGYVRVTNNSGEDYENAQTRLIVGQVHLLDQIADLARRQYPYGRPGTVPPPMCSPVASSSVLRAVEEKSAARESEGGFGRIREVKKEGLSEYFLYTIEGTETIPNGWSKRLPSFDAGAVPVLNLYKYEEERYGDSVVRFLSFKNDKDHTLGETPIPGGSMEVYRTTDKASHLSYEGQSEFKYIPVNQDVELNLGAVGNVVVEPKLMDMKTDDYLFDNHGDPSGWITISRFTIKVKNTREVPVKIEIRRNFDTTHWEVKPEGDYGQFEKVDLNTVKFTMELGAATQKEFSYTLTTRQGLRAE